MKIYETALTRVLFAATDRGPSRFDLKYIKCNMDGSAEATNGRVFVKVFEHHEGLEGTIYIDFEKVANLPKKGELSLGMQEDNIISSKFIFPCKRTTAWPNTERFIPHLTTLSCFTSVCIGLSTLKVLKEVCQLQTSYAPFWAGKPDQANGTCILIHPIPNLLVVGLSDNKDNYIEESAAYHTYMQQRGKNTAKK